MTIDYLFLPIFCTFCNQNIQHRLLKTSRPILACAKLVVYALSGNKNFVNFWNILNQLLCKNMKLCYGNLFKIKTLVFT